MTIKDIAAQCGVSVSTVSRVLNGHKDVSEAARARVLQVVEENHYIPNNSARDLVQVQSPTDAIGLVVRGLGNSFFAEILGPIEQQILGAGYTPVFHQISAGEDELKAGAQLAKSRRLKGLVFLGGRFDYRPEEIAILHVPFVLCSYTNSFGSLSPAQYSSVTIDDFETGRRAAKTLLSRGHRRIAVLLDSVQDRSIGQLRYLGFCSALEEAGISLDPALVAETGEFDMEHAYRRTKTLVRSGTEFTALFSVSDDLAVAAIRALHEENRRVPEDCSVVGVDGISYTRYTIPGLTSFVQPQQRMAEQTVQILLERIEGKGQNRQVVLQSELRPGESVVPPDGQSG